MGVRDFLQYCPWCSHLLVTNDDNGYHPRFLEAAFASRGWDMLTTDFAADGKLTKAAWERGYVDLGGVLATKPLIAAIGGSFTGTLPPNAGALESHDNDWWLIKKGDGGRSRRAHRPRAALLSQLSD